MRIPHALRRAGRGVAALVLLAASALATSPAATAATAGNTGVQNVAVMMVNFYDDASQPVTAAALQAEIFGAASDFLDENSGGRLWLTGSVLGWYSLPISKATCDPTRLADLADQAATAAGVQLSVYTRKFYVFPRNACTFDGLAISGGAATRAWFNGRFDAHNIAHEFGHNLGLAHSHGLDCDTGPLGATCLAQDYGDVADTMGNGPGHFNAFQKERLGWMDGLATVTASGRYALAPYALGKGTRAIKIPRGTDAWYYLEYRQPQGFDAPLASIGTLTSGVLVRKASTAAIDGANSSFLLDTTPNSVLTAADLRDAALLPGRSFVDSSAGVSVTVVSVDANGAVVDISVAGGGTTCITQAPALALSAMPAIVPGGAGSVGITLANRDSSGCAATSFNLTASLPTGWTAQMGSSTLQLSAGATGSTTLSYSAPQGAVAGSYAIGVSAACSRGTACAANVTGAQLVVVPTLSGTVATSKPVYQSGELVGLGAQLLQDGVAVAGASISFTITGPSGKSVMISALTDRTGAAGASYRLNRKKNGPGSYGVRAQATWAGQVVSASTTFQVK